MKSWSPGRHCRFALLALWLVATVSCSHRTNSPAGSNTNQHAATSQALMSDQLTYQFAIYYPSAPHVDPISELDRLLESDQSLQRVEEIGGSVDRPVVAARIESDPVSNYTPPDIEYLQRFGRGLSLEQAKQLQSAQAVLILDWSYPREHVWTGLRSALTLSHQLAANTHGLLWDETTREVFSPEAWHERRIADWTEPVPNITHHILVHAYKRDDSVRAITLGMSKFGLPDVVIDGFSWSSNRDMGHILNLFAQAMAEGATFEVPGDFDLNIREIRNEKVREPQTTTLKSNATGIAKLRLQEGTWEEGDPENRLIEIKFDRGAGPDAFAQQEDILSQAFGWEDSVDYVQHDEAVLAASRRAKTKLPELQKAFREGLQPGEYILVKAPFATSSGGREWMWVEVSTWEGVKITGLLKNEPFDIPDLHAGQIVEVSQGDVFDYIRRLPDGTTEGNETGKVLRKQNE